MTRRDLELQDIMPCLPRRCKKVRDSEKKRGGERVEMVGRRG